MYIHVYMNMYTCSCMYNVFYMYMHGHCMQIIIIVYKLLLIVTCFKGVDVVHAALSHWCRILGLPADFKEGVLFSTYATLVSTVNRGTYTCSLMTWCSAHQGEYCACIHIGYTYTHQEASLAAGCSSWCRGVGGKGSTAVWCLTSVTKPRTSFRARSSAAQRWH